MIKKTIKYTDYNDVKRTEDFYFHLNKPELIELNASTDGGLKNMAERIIKTQDNKSLVEIFKKLILMAYGEKSEDGKRFIKSEESRTAFSQTEAYAELFMSLTSDAKEAAEFFNGIVPSDLAMNFEEIENSAEYKELMSNAE